MNTKLISELKGNKEFEVALRKKYSEEACDIIIEWIEEALRYVLRPTDKEGTFELGRYNSSEEEITYTNEFLTFDNVFACVMNEMQVALEDDCNESRATIEEKFNILSEAY